MKIAQKYTLLFLILWIVSCDSLRTQHLEEIPIKIGGKTILVELAASPSERQRGLMYRRELPEDKGMLFVFPMADRQSFWMKNTYIPLDVGYFDSQGYLIEVLTMEADDGVKTYPSSEPALYALEMNAGWFRKNGFQKFTRMELPRPISGL